MPRNASGVYSPPPGTEANPNTTIASAPYNSLIADITAEMNGARPVTAGGTGATTASEALSSLGISDFALTLLDDADAAAARASLGIPDAFLRFDAAQTLTDAQKVQARANIGVGEEIISNQTGIVAQPQIITTIPAGVREITVKGPLVPSAAGLIYAQVSVDGGATWIATGYATLIANINGSVVSAAGFGHAAIQLTSNIPSLANSPVSFRLELDSLKVPARKPRYRLDTSFEANGGSGEYHSFLSGTIGGLAAGAPINAIRIFPQSGTLSGDYLVKGAR